MSILKQLEEESIYIIREVAEQFNNPCLLFSGGTPKPQNPMSESFFDSRFDWKDVSRFEVNFWLIIKRESE